MSALDARADAPPHRDGADAATEMDPDRRVQLRRISYFMLFRLAMLAGFTALVGVVFTTEEKRIDRTYAWLVLGALVTGYILTIVYARLLPRVRDLGRFASVQTAFDILLSAFVVQMTGGVESGFATLYLIALLGSATMGGRRQTWTAALACIAIYLVMSTLESTQMVLPLTGRSYSPPSPAELWGIVGRTTAGILGVTVLSSYLNVQLASSVSLVGNLRALNENIVRSLNSGLLTIDNDGRLLYFNPAARQILDLDDTLIGRDVGTALPGIGKLGVEEAEPGRRHELELSTPAGRSLHVGLSRAPLRDAEGKRMGWVINFQDVTRLHELAQKVRRNERLAALGSMAASVAHEIRNPLAAISGSAELLAAAELSDEDQRLLGVIGRESTRLGALVNDLLAFTRPRPPEPTPVVLATACRDAAEAFAADPANADVQVVFDGRTDLLVWVDPAQLSQVLWNLMRNASDAMGQNGRLEIRLRSDDRAGYIDVVDDGPGIPSEHVDSIFDPFFTTKDSGTGFGLAIVHRIVEDNGGTISVDSRPGAGTRFTISFPLRAATPQPEDSGVLTP